MQVQVLSKINIDEDGQDNLTDDEGAIANSLYTLCLRKNNLARRKAERAAGDRLKKMKKKKKKNSKDDDNNNDKSEKDDFRRLLPRTAALFGAVIPIANYDVEDDDVQNVYVERKSSRSMKFS